MMRGTQQPFRAILIVKEGKAKILALISDEYRVPLAKHLAKIEGLDGWLSTKILDMAVDFNEVPAVEYEAIRAKALQ